MILPLSHYQSVECKRLRKYGLATSPAEVADQLLLMSEPVKTLSLISSIFLEPESNVIVSHTVRVH